MTLDEQILAEAKEVRQHLVDLETQTAHTRVDYHAAIKKLHAAGGSLHEIADGPAGLPGPQPWMRGGWKHGRRHRGGRNRQHFIARFDDGAREVMVEAQKEADSLEHPYLGTEHLMLALAKRGIEDVFYDAARKQVIERVGEGDEQWIAGLPRPFTPRAKRILEAALHDAVDSGRKQFGTDD